MPANTAKIKPKAPAKPRLSPTAVLSYLQANPAFFEKHKDQLASLSVPTKGGNILSLHGLKADKIAREAETLKIRQKQLISTAQGNAIVAETIFAAVLSLIPCRTMAELRQYLQTGLPTHLGLTAVRLFKAGEAETATTLTAGQIHTLCPQPVTLAPLNAEIHRLLFGPKTNHLKSICLMALTLPDGTYIGLLALGSDDATRFHAGQATNLADFLRQATSTVLAHATV